MTAESNGNKGADPFEGFKNMRDAYLEGMSKVMIDAVNSEEYAQATGTLLTNYLTFTAPFREALDKTMVMALEQLSLPSRQQVTSLAERFTNLEMKLDDIDAKLDRMIGNLEMKLHDTDAKLDRIVGNLEMTLHGTDAKLDRIADNLDMKLQGTDAKLDRIAELSSAARAPVAEATPAPKQPTKVETKPPHQASGKKR